MIAYLVPVRYLVSVFHTVTFYLLPVRVYRYLMVPVYLLCKVRHGAYITGTGIKKPYLSPWTIIIIDYMVNGNKSIRLLIIPLNRYLSYLVIIFHL